jgi:hypothetical protein
MKFVSCAAGAHLEWLVTTGRLTREQAKERAEALRDRLVKALVADDPHVTLLDSGEPWTCPKCGGHLVHRCQSGCYAITVEVDLLSSTYDDKIGDLVDIGGDDGDCDEYRCSQCDEDVERPEEEEEEDET